MPSAYESLFSNLIFFHCVAPNFTSFEANVYSLAWEHVHLRMGLLILGPAFLTPTPDCQQLRLNFAPWLNLGLAVYLDLWHPDRETPAETSLKVQMWIIISSWSRRVERMLEIMEIRRKNCLREWTLRIFSKLTNRDCAMFSQRFLEFFPCLFISLTWSQECTRG